MVHVVEFPTVRSFDSHPCCLGDPAGPAGLPQPSGHRRELPHFEAKMYTCSPLFSRTTSIEKQTETPRAIYEIYATPGLTTLLNDFADEPQSIVRHSMGFIHPAKQLGESMWYAEELTTCYKNK